jgi:hypothetical protein
VSGCSTDPTLLLHIDAAGNVVKTMAEGIFGTVHGFCRDRDGNFWAGDSGPFNAANPEAVKKAYVVHKFSPEGKLLLTIGKAGVQKSGEDTFIGPAACISAPNGDIIIADGHHPRPLTVEGDHSCGIQRRQVPRAYGKQGTGPGESWGRTRSYDSQGRLFVADRSNNRVQIFDKDMNFVDEWPLRSTERRRHSQRRHLVVADSIELRELPSRNSVSLDPKSKPAPVMQDGSRASESVAPRMAHCGTSLRRRGPKGWVPTIRAIFSAG